MKTFKNKSGCLMSFDDGISEEQIKKRLECERIWRIRN